MDPFLHLLLCQPLFGSLLEKDIFFQFALSSMGRAFFSFVFFYDVFANKSYKYL